MHKPKLSTIELFFIIIAASTIFVATFQSMGTAGILPGNDPAVHLLKARQIVMDQRVSYSESAWYPPAFHTILAMLQILAGTLDVMVAAFLLKVMISTFNVLLLLFTYLIARKLLGMGIAVISAVLTLISVLLFEMIFWGGYTNYMGFVYIAFIFYIMTKNFPIINKMFLLFFGALILGLTHQLSTFVFVLMFIPAFLVSTIGSKKRFIVFLAIVIGGGLALLAWYASILIDYTAMIIEYIFSSGAENVYHLSAVDVDALVKNFGTTIFLAAAGIPLTLALILKKKAPKSALLIIFWFAIPFAIAESFLFGIHLPYDRFVYFFATPLTILAAVTLYVIIRIPWMVNLKSVPKLPKSPKLLVKLKNRVVSRIPRKVGGLTFFKAAAVAVMLVLLTVHTFLFVERIEGYPYYYARSSIATYDAGIWVNQHSTPNDVMVVPQSPGTWFYILSNRTTSEETEPLYSRNLIAETVLYSFYEMENGRTLTHEYALGSPNSGQRLGVSNYNIWRYVVKIPNEYIKVVYVNSSGQLEEIPLSETVEKIYWTQQSPERTQLVSEYTHELFTVKKIVTFSSNSSIIDIVWRLEANQDLRVANLAVSNYLEPTLNVTEAFVPGVLDWESPWDRATYVDPDRRWAVTEGPASMLDENVAAVLDAENGILTVFEFGGSLEWFSIGALDNGFIDSLRLTYAFGNLDAGESGEASLNVLLYAFDSGEVERLSEPGFMQRYDSTTVLPVHYSDYLTYVKEYNIKYIIVDKGQVLYTEDLVHDLDVVYNNGRIVVYSTERWR